MKIPITIEVRIVVAPRQLCKAHLESKEMVPGKLSRIMEKAERMEIKVVESVGRYSDEPCRYAESAGASAW